MRINSALWKRFATLLLAMGISAFVGFLVGNFHLHVDGPAVGVGWRAAGMLALGLAAAAAVLAAMTERVERLRALCVLLGLVTWLPASVATVWLARFDWNSRCYTEGEPAACYAYAGLLRYGRLGVSVDPAEGDALDRVACHGDHDFACSRLLRENAHDACGMLRQHCARVSSSLLCRDGEPNPKNADIQRCLEPPEPP